MARSDVRGRYFTFIVFEDNIKDNPNWLDQLIYTRVRFCVSPYHDKDLVNKIDIQNSPERFKESDLGKPKKAHYHVIMHFDGNTTIKTVIDNVTSKIGNIARPEKVNSPDGMYRYLIHEYDEDKFKYDENDIKHYNGSRAVNYISEMTAYTRSKIVDDIANVAYFNKWTKMNEIRIFCQSHPDPRYLITFQVWQFYFKQVIVDNINYLKGDIKDQYDRAEKYNKKMDKILNEK